MQSSISTTDSRQAADLRRCTRRRPSRRGLTFLELLLATSIVVLVAGAIGGLGKAVEDAWSHQQGAGALAQHGRVSLARITRAVEEAAANERFPGFRVVMVEVLKQSAVTMAGRPTPPVWRFPAALVVWRPDAAQVAARGGPAAPGRAPHADEVVIFCPDPTHPNRLIEMRTPGRSGQLPDYNADENVWLAWLVEGLADPSVVQRLLTDRLRTATVPELGRRWGRCASWADCVHSRSPPTPRPAGRTISRRPRVRRRSRRPPGRPCPGPAMVAGMAMDFGKPGSASSCNWKPIATAPGQRRRAGAGVRLRSRLLRHGAETMTHDRNRSQGGKEGDRSMFSDSVFAAKYINWPKNGPVPGRECAGCLSRPARRRRGVAALLVILMISIALSLSYVLVRSQGTAALIQDNAGLAAEARQAAFSGLSAAYAVMHDADDWQGVSSTFTRRLSDYVWFTVEFRTGDDPVRPAAADAKSWPYLVTLVATGHAADPHDPSRVVTDSVKAVTKLVPRALAPQPNGWAEMARHTVYQWDSSATVAIDLPARIEGPAFFAASVQLGVRNGWSDEPRMRYFLDLENARRGCRAIRPSTATQIPDDGTSAKSPWNACDGWFNSSAPVAETLVSTTQQRRQATSGATRRIVGILIYNYAATSTHITDGSGLRVSVRNSGSQVWYQDFTSYTHPLYVKLPAGGTLGDTVRLDKLLPINPSATRFRLAEVMIVVEDGTPAEDQRPFTGPLESVAGRQSSDLLKALDWMGVTKSDVVANVPSAPAYTAANYQIYRGGAQYTAELVSAASSTPSDAVPAANPLRVYYTNSRCHLGNNFRLTGTLFAGDGIDMEGTGVTIAPCVLPALVGDERPIQLPAVVSVRDIALAGGSASEIEGLVLALGSLVAVQDSQWIDKLVLQGGLVARGLSIEPRSGWLRDQNSWWWRHWYFIDDWWNGFSRHFPLWLSDTGLDSHPRLRTAPASAPVHYHWQKRAGTDLCAPRRGRWPPLGACSATPHWRKSDEEDERMVYSGGSGRGLRARLLSGHRRSQGGAAPIGQRHRAADGDDPRAQRDPHTAGRTERSAQRAERTLARDESGPALAASAPQAIHEPQPHETLRVYADRSAAGHWRSWRCWPGSCCRTATPASTSNSSPVRGSSLPICRTRRAWQ